MCLLIPFIQAANSCRRDLQLDDSQQEIAGDLLGGHNLRSRRSLQVPFYFVCVCVTLSHL